MAVPVEHKLDVGLLDERRPFADPQTPLTPMALTGAEHDAVEPPLLPTQLQFHGPVPENTEAVPELHKPDVGVLD